ncbi:hypothetical protein HYE25_02330 [Mycoplasmopsis bovis]|nr:hypothetical protein [Mycoplasmopsis bovis]QQH23474.1 hypothetical protein HYE25_02330 [Mycoplasmopsis bovis]
MYLGSVVWHYDYMNYKYEALILELISNEFLKIGRNSIKLDEIKRRFGKLAKSIKLDNAINWLLKNPEMKLKVNWGHLNN